MDDFDVNQVPASSVPRRFQTTRWSLVLAARCGEQKEAREALATLCETYWYPIYAFVRHKGYTADDSLDLVQGFFARLLEKGDLISADRSKGRLRSFLMASCSHYLSNQLDHKRAKRRGGDRERISIDATVAEGRYSLEPAHELTAERLFEQRWATTLLGMVISRLEDEMTQAGKARQFAILRPALSGGAERGRYAEIAAALGVSEDAARAAAHRLRLRFRELIREEIGITLDDPADVEDEIRQLFVTLGS
jgi:DNA-directed RNA polymerase specialized sigma24 family protein